MVETLIKSKENVELDSKFLAKAVIRLIKQDILQRYRQKGEISDDDWEFCEKIDWHPIDELPPKPEHLELLKRSLKETGKVYSSAEEFFKELDPR